MTVTVSELLLPWATDRVAGEGASVKPEPTPTTATASVLPDWSVAVSDMPSVPAITGLKLTAVANEAPPLKIDTHVPVVPTVAVAVELMPAAKVTDGAGLEEQAASFTRVVTGLMVAEGLTAVPTGDAGTMRLSIVSCATVSGSLALKAVEDAARYRLPCLLTVIVFAPCVETA